MLTMGLGRPERLLILNYNTIALQSVGFVERMLEAGLDDKVMRRLDQPARTHFFIHLTNRNPASVIDSSINEVSYFSFIQSNYAHISQASPITTVHNVATITSRQSFIDRVTLASYTQYPALDKYKSFHHTTFDIFNVKEVEDYIRKEKITSVMVHDIRMVHDLVFNFRINVSEMTFIVSKLGYNFSSSKSGDMESLCPEVFELRKQFKFHIAYINLTNNTRGLNPLEV